MGKVSVALRKNGEKMVFVFNDPEGMSTDQIRKISAEEIPGAHPILIGLPGGKSRASGNDGDVTPSVA